ncbi:colanic acid biosynthesis pyruvyl transferase WcaK [Mesorhizobium sp. M0913]|uniref:colanic acid biosynthesis pyruvyl transferase WcaK n=1 Tax=Mesorhizobium sp. M0913 TaxID=2957026 RepID=UPI003339F0EC
MTICSKRARNRETTRILLVGNHTCGNRGDAAIVRGLVTHLEFLLPDAEIVVTSRYPVSSAFLLGRPVIPDVMERWFEDTRPLLPARVGAKCRRDLVPIVLGLATHPKWRWLRHLLPPGITRQIEWLTDFDIVIQVGGSFFVDLYGYRQFETPFAAIIAERPLLLLGHSMGPFGSKTYRFLAAQLLRRASIVSLRESVSYELLVRDGLPTHRVTNGSDTAWLVPNDGPAPRWLLTLPNGRPLVGITLRELAPFDKRLNISQEQYEKGFAVLADQLIDKGFEVIACSTCTGIDSYHRDDRMVALRVKSRVHQRKHFHVVMNELNDVELGLLFREFRILIGTRLHSAIIAMNFGTPAISLNYEHKSAGILAQLGLPELAAPVSSIVDGSLLRKVEGLLSDLPSVRSRVRVGVERERQKALQMLSDAIASLVPSKKR